MSNSPSHRVFATLGLALALLPRLLSGQELPKQSPRIVSYDIEVELLPDDKTLIGTQSIDWRNATKSDAKELRFHLYLNAFRAPEKGPDGQKLWSTLMLEAGSEFRRKWSEAHGEFGWARVTDIVLVNDSGRVNLMSGAGFVSPDGNMADRTVWRVKLPKPVKPGESIKIETRFEARMPKAYRRTGWAPGNTFFGMQWFPKLGVLEDTPSGNRWNCHQFHANTEFYADFGNYKVAILLPKEYQVGATGGEPITVIDRAGDKRLWTFAESDVHDFAFVASPRYRVYRKFSDEEKAADDKTGIAPAVAKELGVDVSTFDLPRVKILLMILPEHDTTYQRHRHFHAVKTAIRFFGLRYGPYPYKTITVVDPPHDLRTNLGGGMEYPTLITCGTTLIPHSREMRPEGVTIHEFGHQYWYGLSANNEFEESWLDEGINTYSEGRAQTLEYIDGITGKPTLPTQTTRFGLLGFSGAAAPTRPARGVAGHGRLPFINDLMSLLPDEVRRTLQGKLHFHGRIMPENSTVLDLIRTQPFVSFYREPQYHDAWNDRRRLFSVDNPDPMVRKGWKYLSRNAYVANSYHRPATLLRTMERMVGTVRWWAFLRRFHAATRYRHANTQQFLQMLEEHCGNDARVFFQAAIGARMRLDYGIESVVPANGKGRRKVVKIRRYGTLAANVRVRFKFKGRTEPVWRELYADDAEAWKAFVFEGGFGDLLEVWVDPPPTKNPYESQNGPAGVYILDSNLLNNGWRAARDARPARYRALRQLLQVQSQLSFAGLIG